MAGKLGSQFLDQRGQPQPEIDLLQHARRGAGNFCGQRQLGATHASGKRHPLVAHEAVDRAAQKVGEDTEVGQVLSARMPATVARQGADERLGQRLLNEVIRREMAERLGGQAVPGAFEPAVRVGAQLRHRGGRVGGLVEKVTGPVREAGFHQFEFGVDLAPRWEAHQTKRATD